MVEGDIGTGDWLNWHKYSSNAYAALLRDMKNLAALSDKYRLEFSSDIFAAASGKNRRSAFSQVDIMCHSMSV